MFFDRFKQLCDEKGISIYKAATEIGLNRAAANKWKAGSIPNGQTLTKLADLFGVTNDYLLGKENDSDERLLIHAKAELSTFINNNPNSTSGQRLEKLFDYSGYDHIVVCFNLGIEASQINNWMDSNKLPPNPVVDKLLGVFHIKPEELFSANELEEYKENAFILTYETKNAPTKDDKRITDDDIKFALFKGDGEITDAMLDEVKAFAAFVQQREKAKEKK